ncbi:MAG: MMPL family transporter [Actinobacteria bacterium]|nr:MMPL family transporter [Actinomycetota bacterium]
MERLTRLMIRFRWAVLAAWLVALLAGGFASTKLSGLLANSFTVPGTDSERVREVLSSDFGDRSDGSFTVVFQVPGSSDTKLSRDLQESVDRAAHVVPTAHATELRAGGPHLLYGDVTSRLTLSDAKGYSDDLLNAIGQPPGVHAYVTGAAAIQAGLDPIFNSDLARGESIALPIALLVLLAVFGLSWAITMPFIFAGSTIMGTLGIVYLLAHEMTMATYVTNLVQLIGLGIAIDYSLLIVYRFREELERPGSVDDAIVRTMATAGRAVIFSGATVAIGLALLLAMPIPFMRSMGVGGFLIPLVSVAAAATLQPALLAIYGRRGTKRVHVAAFLRERFHVPLPAFRGTSDPEQGFWARLARAIMRRPVLFLTVGVALLLAAAVPVFALQLTPGSVHGIPRSPQAVRGFDLLTKAVGPGVVSPSQVLVDAGPRGNVLSQQTQQAVGQFIQRVQADPEIAHVFYTPGGRFVDPSHRYAQVIVAGKHEYGDEPSQRFVKRLRSRIIPSVTWPNGVVVRAGGGPPQGVDFLHRSYSTFPWLVVGVLVLTYFLLLRAFRSLILPLKAVILNLLSVAAAYGMLVIVFRWGAGKEIAGLYQFSQIEGWIPIFLFAMLFGLSMDYEVFLVTRMREAWDERGDNARAVAEGLERTGRIVTAAAIIMVAAFSGFVAGRVLGLQEFGMGLAVAIFVDATIVRALLVPSLMALFGRWNWWLPARVARILRVKASPLPAER